VDIILVSTDPKLITEIYPSSLYIEEKQIKDIQILVTAPETETETTISITVFYGDKSVSQTTIMQWQA